MKKKLIALGLASLLVVGVTVVQKISYATSQTVAKTFYSSATLVQPLSIVFSGAKSGDSFATLTAVPAIDQDKLQFSTVVKGLAAVATLQVKVSGGFAGNNTILILKPAGTTSFSANTLNLQQVTPLGPKVLPVHMTITSNVNPNAEGTTSSITQIITSSNGAGSEAVNATIIGYMAPGITNTDNITMPPGIYSGMLSLEAQTT